MDRLDIIIFGATGFTGKWAVVEMVRLAARHPGLSWGVAGRSRSKLESLMNNVAQITGSDQSHIKLVVADVSEYSSVQAMCRSARVLANCCGPYRQLGEAVVRAAVEASCHYVDITGEPQFMESMQLKYDGSARESGVYVVSACGFDSVPNDMGVVFLQQQFGGTLNSVESYLRTEISAQFSQQAWKQGAVHYGTYDSLVQSVSHMHELAPLRKQLYPEKMPNFEPKLKSRGVIHRSPRTRWAVPFPGADNSIVYRSQRTLYTRDHVRPVQFKAYLELDAWWHVVLMIIGAVGLFLMTRLAVLSRLLLAHPRVFSVGMVSHEGPTRDLMDHTAFSMTLYGEGWAEGTDVTEPVNKRMVAKVSGTNPGYGATVTALLLCGITILHEAKKMPQKGGVLTTAVAFKDTTLIEKLNENGLKFEIIETSTI